LLLHFYNFVLILHDLFLLLLLALCGDKQKLLGVVEKMKILVCNNHNRAEEVITRAEEALALAMLIRHGADRDIVQVQKTVEDLSQKLPVSDNGLPLCGNLSRPLQSFFGLLKMMEGPGATSSC
jgi:hypothetical protein